jgi:DNA-binding response OmpR family regulator
LISNIESNGAQEIARCILECRVRVSDRDDAISESKVLIVDDEYHTRKTIRALLHAMGCRRVHEAADGHSGLEAIRAVTPDVLLLAWDLPDMDGVEFLRALHTGAGARGMPIIMLTGDRERTPVLDAVRHGVHEFLLKPVSRGALSARLHSALETSAQRVSAPKLAS